MSNNRTAKAEGADQWRITPPLPPPGVGPEGVVAFLKQLYEASRSRPTFDTPAAETRRAVRLSTGSAPNRLIGFPAPLALCGPQQFARFAHRFRDVRDLLVLPIPGFVGREHLPATVQVAVRDQAESILRNMGDHPPVLMGYSSGGALAYGLAGHLETRGIPVAAVVLLDSYPSGSNTPATIQLQALILQLLNRPEWQPFLNDTRLTAMGWYTQLMLGWDLEAIEAPTLLVRAKDPLPGVVRDLEWRPVWPLAHEAVDVVGNHFTIVEEHADEAAEAVENWLRSTLA